MDLVVVAAVVAVMVVVAVAASSNLTHNYELRFAFISRQREIRTLGDDKASFILSHDGHSRRLPGEGDLFFSLPRRFPISQHAQGLISDFPKDIISH